LVFVIGAIVVLVFSTSRRLLYSQSVDTEMVEALPSLVFSSARSKNCHAKETCAIWLEDTKMKKFCSFCFCACPVISLWYYNFNSCNCSACNLFLVFGCLQLIPFIILILLFYVNGYSGSSGSKLMLK
jgi:hypothetical protein